MQTTENDGLIDTLVYQLEDDNWKIRLKTVQKLRSVIGENLLKQDKQEFIFPVRNFRRFLNCLRRRLRDQNSHILSETLDFITELIPPLSQNKNDLDQLVGILFPPLLFLLGNNPINESDEEDECIHLISLQVTEILRVFLSVTQNSKLIFEILINEGLYHVDSSVRELAVAAIIKVIMLPQINFFDDFLEVTPPLIEMLEDREVSIVVSAEEALGIIKGKCGNKYEDLIVRVSKRDKILLNEHKKYIDSFVPDLEILNGTSFPTTKNEYGALSEKHYDDECFVDSEDLTTVTQKQFDVCSIPPSLPIDIEEETYINNQEEYINFQIQRDDKDSLWANKDLKNKHACNDSFEEMESTSSEYTVIQEIDPISKKIDLRKVKSESSSPTYSSTKKEKNILSKDSKISLWLPGHTPKNDNIDLKETNRFDQPADDSNTQPVSSRSACSAEHIASKLTSLKQRHSSRREKRRAISADAKIDRNNNTNSVQELKNDEHSNTSHIFNDTTKHTRQEENSKKMASLEDRPILPMKSRMDQPSEYPEYDFDECSEGSIYKSSHTSYQDGSDVCEETHEAKPKRKCQVSKATLKRRQELKEKQPTQGEQTGDGVNSHWSDLKNNAINDDDSSNVKEYSDRPGNKISTTPNNYGNKNEDCGEEAIEIKQMRQVSKATIKRRQELKEKQVVLSEINGDDEDLQSPVRYNEPQTKNVSKIESQGKPNSSTVYLDHSEVKQIIGCSSKHVIKTTDLMRSTDWEDNIDGLMYLRRLALNHNEYIDDAFLSAMLPQIMKHIDNLRSSVAKNAMLALESVFLGCNRNRILDNCLEMLTPVLLKRCADKNTFLSESGKQAILVIVESPASVSKLINAFLSNVNDKSHLIRKCACESLALVISVNSSSKLQACKELDRALKIMGNLLNDATAGVRDIVKGSFISMIQTEKIDSLQIKRCVSSQAFEKVLQNLNSKVKKRGFQPTKKNIESHIKKAESTEKESHGEFGLECKSTKKVPREFRKTLKKATSSSNILKAPGFDEFLLIEKSLDSSNWKDRFNALEELESILILKPNGLCETGKINQIFDVLNKRLEDANSKVHLRSLKVLEQIIPVFGRSFNSIVSTLVPVLGRNLANRNQQIILLAENVLTSLIDEVDLKAICPPLVNVARHGNSRVKCGILKIIERMVSSSDDSKATKAVFMKFLVPLVLELSAESKSDIKAANSGLTTVLFNITGKPMLNAIYKLPGAQQEHLLRVLNI